MYGACYFNVNLLFVSLYMHSCRSLFGDSGNTTDFLQITPIRNLSGGIKMKIVVVKSPNFLKGILRLIFGIKKEEE